MIGAEEGIGMKPLGRIIPRYFPHMIDGSVVLQTLFTSFPSIMPEFVITGLSLSLLFRCRSTTT